MSDMSWEHASEARAALNAIVNDPEHGVAALSSAQTMSNLLKDLLPDAPREKSILVAAAEAGIASTLRGHVSQGMDARTAINLTASSFSATTPFTSEACAWVTAEIASVLGISQPSPGGGFSGAPAGFGPAGQQGMPTRIVAIPGAGFPAGMPAAPGTPAAPGMPAAPGTPQAPGQAGGFGQGGGFGQAASDPQATRPGAWPPAGGFGQAGTPEAGTPGAGTPGAGAPGTGTPGTPQAPSPGAGQPTVGAWQAGAAGAAFGQPGAGAGGFGQAGGAAGGFGQPGAGAGGFGQPGAAAGGFGQAGSAGGGFGQPEGFGQAGGAAGGFGQQAGAAFGQPGTGQQAPGGWQGGGGFGQQGPGQQGWQSPGGGFGQAGPGGPTWPQGGGGYSPGGGFGPIPGTKPKGRRGLWIASGMAAVLIVIIVIAVSLSGGSNGKHSTGMAGAHSPSIHTTPPTTPSVSPTPPVTAAVDPLPTIMQLNSKNAVGTSCSTAPLFKHSDGSSVLNGATITNRVFCARTSRAQVDIWAYQFDSRSDFQAGLSSINDYVGFIPASASLKGCPPPAGFSEGKNIWFAPSNPKYSKHRSGQVLECHTGSKGNPQMIWAMPTQFAFFVAQDNNNSDTSKDLYNWWTTLNYG